MLSGNGSGAEGKECCRIGLAFGTKGGEGPCGWMFPLTLLGVLLRVNSFAALCIHSWYIFLCPVAGERPLVKLLLLIIQ